MWFLALSRAADQFSARSHKTEYNRKTYKMITQNKLINKLMLISLLILTAACSKEGEMDPDPAVGEPEELAGTISVDEFEIDEGEIGISISARDIAKRGYQPMTAEISIPEVSSIANQTIAFDEFNNLANLTFKNEELDESVESELKEGVPIDVTVKDENGNVLATESYSKISFRASPDALEIDASSLDDLFASVSLKEDLDYYVQLVNEENIVYGAPASQRYPDVNNKATAIRLRGTLDYNENPDFFESFTTYRFAKIPNNEDYFSIAVHNANDIHYLYKDQNGRLNIQSKANLNANESNTNVEDFPDYWFKIVKQGPGLFKIVPNGTENPLILSGEDFIIADNPEPEDPTYFRILLFNIDWDIQAIESKFLPPIMPGSGTESAYNSTLRNCSSSSSLAQGISENRSITTTQTIGWEETMSVATTNSAGVSVTISHEAETKFFGVGGKTSGSITGNYQYTKTRTETSTTSGSLIEEKSVDITFKRDVGVPPKTAISVADVYQEYQNVKVPFIQRFRIFGKYQEDNSALTGQQILTQFAFNSFSGVVTDVQSDFIEVTVRGNTIIDRLIQTVTETRDIPGACD